jgi:hypothetical protein
MTEHLPTSPETPQQPGTPAGKKAKAGRPKGTVRDSELSSWLEHLRKWGETAAPTTGTNWDRVNTAKAEASAAIRPVQLTKWYSRTKNNGSEIRLNRQEYLRLAALLKAWYGYEPPATLPTT